MAPLLCYCVCWVLVHEFVCVKVSVCVRHRLATDTVTLLHTYKEGAR